MDIVKGPVLPSVKFYLKINISWANKSCWKNLRVNCRRMRFFSVGTTVGPTGTVGIGGTGIHRRRFFFYNRFGSAGNFSLRLFDHSGQQFGGPASSIKAVSST